MKEMYQGYMNKGKVGKLTLKTPLKHIWRKWKKIKVKESLN